MNRIFKNCRVYNPLSGEYDFRDLFVEKGMVSSHKPKLAEVIDLKGCYLYPGLVDSHAHLLATGKREFMLDLSEIRTKDEFVALLKNLKKQSVGFVEGRGWDQEKLGFMPDRKFLDGITSVPLLLVRVCGHVATVNSSMIKRYSLNALEGIDGTDLERGLIKGRALERLRKKLPVGKEELREYILAGANLFLMHGITVVHSDDYHGIKLEDLIEELSTQDHIRIYEKLKIESSHELEGFKAIQNSETDFFSLRAAKIYLDGSFGSRTAALCEPYADEPENSGVLYLTSEELLPFVKKAEKEGIQLTLHVIGDRALKEALKAFSVIRKGNPLKHRLIHVQIATRGQIQQIANLKLKVSIQPVFFKTDRKMAFLRLGPERFKNAYPFKKMSEAGVDLAMSTDAPVESVNPFRNMRSAEHFFDRKHILYMYMVSGKLFENNKFTFPLAVGSPADFFLTEKDLLSVPGSMLEEMKVSMTVFNGRVVYER
ncbi:hypothetical protein AT15_08040 [Kosmotoga arenicorallina S304]|uniref:Amidohydrolase 3 domain-containing protein n=1 Tax=Kosmotoga arenicorallina S304 TaxID=1453497 RepID=A0A182C7B9_9BACT|nr:amidohydrolase [Kosmotoga arenicorallina]OAA31435.1 hypothetical protein AT15_08040 [Kosmotoga arenicorallina S304]